MISQDRAILAHGMLALMQDPRFITFDGATFTLNETALETYLRAISNAGANAIRILPWGPWADHPYGKKSQFQAFVLNEALDKWDLSQFNTYYFPIMKRVFAIANAVNLTVIFCWFDNCQFTGTAYSQWSPWAHHTQTAPFTTFYDQRADIYSSAWIGACLTQFGGYDVYWAWGNEINPPTMPAMAKRVIHPIIAARNLDFNKMLYGATMKSVTYLGGGLYIDPAPPDTLDIMKKDVGLTFPPDDNKLDMYKEVHKCGGPAEGVERPYGARLDQALWWWGNHPIRIYISDDGVWDGDSTCDYIVFAGHEERKPSATRWYDMMHWVFSNYRNAMGRDRLLNFEHLPEGLDTACQVATHEAMSRAYKDEFGVYPYNYGEYGPIVPPPPATTFDLYIRTVPVSCSVTIDGVTKSTGVDGIVLFTLPADTYTAIVVKAGYVTQNKVITIPPARTVVVTLATEPVTPGTYRVIVVSSPDGCTVKVGGVTKVGAAYFDLAAGTYTIEVSKTGYVSQSISCTVPPAVVVNATLIAVPAPPAEPETQTFWEWLLALIRSIFGGS